MGLYDEDIGGSAPTEADLRRLSPAPTAPARRAPVGRYEEDIGGPQVPVPAAAPVPNAAFGELKTADPSWTQWLKWKAMGGLEALGMKPHAVQHFGNAAVDLPAAITPLGAGLSAAELTYDLPRGNIGAAAFDALGALPLVSGASRLAHGYPRARTAPEVSELKGSASQSYKAAEHAPLEYDPNAMVSTTSIMRRGMESPNYPGPMASVFSPEKAPEVYSTLNRFDRNFPAGGTRPVTPSDFEALRQDLRGFKGPSGPAGHQAIQAMEAYTLSPPPGMLTRGTAADLAQARADLVSARGDYRAAKTAGDIEKALVYGERKGRPADKTLEKFTTTAAGERKLFGATPEERATLAAAANDPGTKFLRGAGNFFSGPSTLRGLGAAATRGGAAGGISYYAGGQDPYTAGAIGLAGAVAPPMAGARLRGAANTRAARLAREAVDQIKLNSPLNAAREAASPPVADPRYGVRDALAYALLPQAAKAGKDWWDQQFVPYANRPEER